MLCLVFSTHGQLVDSRGEDGLNSIKTGSSVTPDPIKLLAPVRDHDVNDNATEDNRRDRRRQTETRQIVTWQEETGMEIYSAGWNVYEWFQCDGQTGAEQWCLRQKVVEEEKASPCSVRLMEKRNATLADGRKKNVTGNFCIYCGENAIERYTGKTGGTNPVRAQRQCDPSLYYSLLGFFRFLSGFTLGLV